jgi:hypothetical protein
MGGCKTEGCDKFSAGYCEGYCLAHFKHINPTKYGIVSANKQRAKRENARARALREAKKPKERQHEGGSDDAHDDFTNKTTRICKTEGCDKFHVRSGYCRKCLKKVDPAEYAKIVTAKKHARARDVTSSMFAAAIAANA